MYKYLVSRYKSDMALIFTILTCLIVVCATGAQKITFENVSPDITDNIDLIFIQGPTVNDYVIIKLEDGLSLPTYVGFDPQRETVFHFHGWSEQPTNNQLSFNVLGNAFLQRNTANVVFFDYSNLVQDKNGLGYGEAFINASHIGNAIGQFWQKYIPTIQPVENLHLTGFSLGCPIMSKSVRTYGPGQFKWLTAMDPAGPLYNIPGAEQLSKDDAEFVEVIHTDAGFFGEARSIGTVDFYPNKGTRTQPFCITGAENLWCSHLMAFKYYAEALGNPEAFPAKKCNRLGICSSYNGEFIYMGYNVDKNAQGDFFFDTNSQEPFGKGMAGMDNYKL